MDLLSKMKDYASFGSACFCLVIAAKRSLRLFGFGLSPVLVVLGAGGVAGANDLAYFSKNQLKVTFPEESA